MPRHLILDSGLQQSVDSAWIAGAVALVLRDGEVVYERAVQLMTTSQVGSRYNASGQWFGFATTDRLGANGFNSVGTPHQRHTLR